MKEAAAGENQRDAVRRLNRRALILIALAFAAMVGAGGILELAPPIVADVVSKLFGAAFVASVGAYFLFSGLPEHRRARASVVFAWVALLGVAPAIFIAQRLNERNDFDRFQAQVKAMGVRIAQWDAGLEPKVKALRLEQAVGAISSQRSTDAAARTAARSSLASAVQTMDEFLAGRERIVQETITGIEAASASRKVKRVTLAAIRDAVADKVPMSVQAVKAMRAWFAKAGEVVAHLDSHAAGLAFRDPDLVFADGAAADRYNLLLAELGELERELARIKQQIRKPG